MKTRIEQRGNWYHPQYRNWFRWTKIPVAFYLNEDTKYCTPDLSVAEKAINDFKKSRAKVTIKAKIIKYP